MQTFRLYLVGAMLAAIGPTALFGHSYGPPPRVAGAPGDDARACAQCHTGSALNSGTGSVKIVLQSGLFYIPDVKQREAVRVSYPVHHRRASEWQPSVL